MGLIDRLPKLACIQASGCAPMVNSFRKGLEVAEPVTNPQTLITTVATGYPGMAYTYLRQVILEHGGAFEAVSDDEAFRAMHVMAKMDGISMEPAAGLAFAGLFKMVSAGIIKPDDVVVVNCSGHTFPVEKHLLGDAWAQSLDATEAERAEIAEEGLLTSLDRLDTRVQRIAIIEDDPDARRLLRRVLQARGEYQIFEAKNGREGLEMVRRHRPDLVLLDLMMPEVDGFEVMETIRADEELADTRIIVITAKTLTAGERRRLSGQIELLLQKGSFLDDDLLEDILATLQETVTAYKPRRKTWDAPRAAHFSVMSEGRARCSCSRASPGARVVPRRSRLLLLREKALPPCFFVGHLQARIPRDEQDADDKDGRAKPLQRAKGLAQEDKGKEHRHQDLGDAQQRGLDAAQALQTGKDQQPRQGRGKDGHQQMVAQPSIEMGSGAALEQPGRAYHHGHGRQTVQGHRPGIHVRQRPLPQHQVKAKQRTGAEHQGDAQRIYQALHPAR